MMYQKNKVHRRSMATLMLSLVLFMTSCGSTNVESKKTENEVKDEFVQLIDGNTLNGWEGDPAYWRVENGVLIGETTASTPPLKTNTFLTWRGDSPADFEFIADFKISTDGNSGINYRSEEVEGVPFALKGYQADIDGRNNYTGQNYEERKRTTLAYRGEIITVPTSEASKSENNAWTGRINEGSLGSSDSLKTLIKSEDWNECRLVVKGNRLQHYINGVLMSDVTDEDTNNRKLSGLLGIQIHVGPPMKVEYKNVRLKQM